MPDTISPFRIYRVEKDDSDAVRAQVATASLNDLPAGEVVIRVRFSSLNYKDALAATGHPGVAPNLPHVPGIDAAGEVAESTHEDFREGDPVLVTGYELGAPRWGGWSEYIRVPAQWVVPLPEGLTLREAMCLGTAGFTAAQCVAALELQGVAPDRGDVAITGASGGVGSLALRILARLGYKLVAVSGKQEAKQQLLDWGAAEVVGRDAVLDESDRPLLKARWAGAVDTVGGKTLATLLRATDHRGCVAACGMVGGADLPLTVYPFILRGVRLIGIDSAQCPRPERLEIWRRLAADWKPPRLDEQVSTVSLEQVGEAVKQILAGKAIGRTLVSPAGQSD